MLRPLGNVVVLMPPLSIADAELDELLAIAHASIVEATEPGTGVGVSAAPPGSAAGQGMPGLDPLAPDP